MDRPPPHPPDQNALTDTPPAFVDSLNTLLMAGQMSSPMRTAIISHLNGITNGNLSEQRRVRAAQAIILVVTSPEFSIQK